MPDDGAPEVPPLPSKVPVVHEAPNDVPADQRADEVAPAQTLSAPVLADPAATRSHAEGPVESLPDDVLRVLDALPPGSALLVTGLGTGVVQRFLLDQDKVTAGRHPRSDIFLDHATVSRSHLEIIRQGGRFVARDAGSLNGVYVNGLRVDEAVLSSGDVAQVGRYRLTFLERPA